MKTNVLKRREFFSFARLTPRQAIPFGRSRGYWLHASRTAMACRFEITLPASETHGVRIAHLALDEINKLDDQLSVFREQSEVSSLNRNAPWRTVTVTTSLYELLITCERLSRDTEGAFDITSGPLTRCWGFLKREGRVPDSLELERAKAMVGIEGVAFSHETESIRFKTAGMEINLGSIGKGYALDRAASLMSTRVRAAMLSAGSSSIRLLGDGDFGHDGWKVGIRDPRDFKKRLAVLSLRDCAMSTSGSEEQSFEHDGKRYGHIIDPRSGEPANRVAGVTVVAQSAAVTDALATAFYVGGAPLAERYCAGHPETMVVMLESESEKPIIIGSNSNCEVDFA